MLLLHREGGNVLFLILIAIVLFVALGYSVGRSTSGTPQVGQEKARAEAAALINIFTGIKASYERMRFSLDQPVALSSGLSTTCFPGVTICKASCTSGAACFWSVNPSVPKTVTVNGDQLQIYAFSENHNRGLAGHGVSHGDELIWVIGLKKEICQGINSILGIDGIPVDANDYPMSTAGALALVGYILTPHSACFQNTTKDFYAFYNLLLAH